MLSKLRPLLAALVCVLASCNNASNSLQTAACFPVEAQKWLTRAPSTQIGDKPAINGVTVYLDRSASMVGYITGASASERPLQDLISILPSVTRSASSNIVYRAFGKRVGEPVIEGNVTMQQASFFACSDQPRGTDCDNQETRLDVVLDAIEKKPLEVSVLISDLWLSNSDIQTSGMTSLKPTLSRILETGRSISIYGIKSPFSGSIYDLPGSSSKSAKIKYIGSHPLFVIVIGPKSSLVEIDKELARSGSSYIAGGLQGGEIKHSFFGLNPRVDEVPETDKITTSAHPQILPSTFMQVSGIYAQQFEISRTTSLGGALASAAPSWTAPSNAMFVRNAVWVGPIETRTKVWRRINSECKATAWLPPVTTQNGWSKLPNGQAKFTFDPKALAAVTASAGVYLLVPEVVRTSLASPNERNQWMYGDWNLAPNDAARVSTSSPDMFPTMNLSEIARLLEGSLATAAERQQSALVATPILVNVK